MTDEQAMPSSPPTVREATAGDAEALYSLAQELADALGDRSPRLEAVRTQLDELLEETRARVLVAEDEGGILGAASLWIKPDLAHGDVVIEMPMLIVSKEARRRGVGRLLVKEVQSIAIDENATLIELVATRENNAARSFYKSLGFVETEHIALEFIGDIHDPPDTEE
jgi:ribosomal protein S18 acetylase RimI-like enzyme